MRQTPPAPPGPRWLRSWPSTPSSTSTAPSCASRRPTCRSRSHRRSSAPCCPRSSRSRRPAVSSSNTERALPEVLVAMPQMGVSVAEGTVAVWHKRAGDWVQKDEVICEISTDKIDSDVPSPATGRVAELLVAEDETVPVGTPLARIATDAAPGEAHPDEHDVAAAGRGAADAGTVRDAA